MKKGDIIIISIILAIAFISGLFFLFGGSKGQKVVISQNNKTLYEISLHEEKKINLKTNLIIIKNGKVYVEEANCANQICVNHKPISKKGETIACLPNKVLIEIK